MSLPLEEFGQPPKVRKLPEARPGPMVDAEADATYDRAYNAGWDDAMAQVDTEQGRIGDRLRDRLEALEIDQAETMRRSVAALEPMLHEIFDKLLPRAAERGFLGVLMEEVGALAAEEAGRFTIQVAPEEAPRVTRLLARTDLAADRVEVRPEPALALSQALIRWEANERRVDLESVLSALDDALESFLETLAPEDEND